METSIEVFVYYRLYAPRLPLALFGRAPFWETCDRRTTGGCAILLGAGVVRQGAVGEKVLARECGFLYSGQEPFAEEVTSRLIGPDDRVLVSMDKAFCPEWEDWSQALQNEGADVFIHSDAVTAVIDGRSLGKSRWLGSASGFTEAYLLAAPHGRSKLQRSIIAAASSGKGMTSSQRMMDSFWRKFVADPQDALDRLGDYTVFVFEGGFSPEDLVLQLRSPDSSAAEAALKASARSRGLPLYEAPPVMDQLASAKLWNYDVAWQPLPAELRRVA